MTRHLNRTNIHHLPWTQSAHHPTAAFRFRSQRVLPSTPSKDDQIGLRVCHTVGCHHLFSREIHAVAHVSNICKLPWGAEKNIGTRTLLAECNSVDGKKVETQHGHGWICIHTLSCSFCAWSILTDSPNRHREQCAKGPRPRDGRCYYSDPAHAGNRGDYLLFVHLRPLRYSCSPPAWYSQTVLLTYVLIFEVLLVSQFLPWCCKLCIPCQLLTPEVTPTRQLGVCVQLVSMLLYEQRVQTNRGACKSERKMTGRMQSRTLPRIPIYAGRVLDPSASPDPPRGPTPLTLFVPARYWRHAFSALMPGYRGFTLGETGTLCASRY
ncbi:hypothetical protein J3F83DRAFT_311693 [Trichoderma novae-zelandiae]